MDPLDSTVALKPDGELDTAPTMDDHDVTLPVTSSVGSPTSHRWEDVGSDLTSEGTDSWIVLSDDDRRTPEARHSARRVLVPEEAEGTGYRLPFAPPTPTGSQHGADDGDSTDLPADDDVDLVTIASNESVDAMTCSIESGDSMPSASPPRLAKTNSSASSSLGTGSGHTTPPATDGALWDAVVATDADATKAAAAELESLNPDSSDGANAGDGLDDEKNNKQFAQQLWDATQVEDEKAEQASEPRSISDHIRDHMHNVYNRNTKWEVLPIVVAHVASFLIGLYIGRKSIGSLGSSGSVRASFRQAIV